MKLELSAPSPWPWGLCDEGVHSIYVAGTVVVQVTKLNRGDHFPSLDMLTTLLPHKQRRSKDLRKVGEKPMIEVLESGAVDKEGMGGPSDGRELTNEEERRKQESREEEDWDWKVDQNSSTEAEVRFPPYLPVPNMAW